MLIRQRTIEASLGLSILLAVPHAQQCCGQRPAKQDTLVDIPTLETPTGRAPAHFKRYLGDGFSLDLPFDAQVARELVVPGVPPEIAADMDSVVRISGMSLDVTDTSAQEGFEREVGPIYDLSVRVLTNSNEEALGTWVRRKFDQELAGIGLTEQELWETGASFHPPVADTVAGLPAVRYMPPCPDCNLYVTCFGRDQAVVEITFSFSFFAGGGEPLRAVREVIYAHILNSFRWRQEEDP